VVLGKATDTFSWWQQIPAWLLGLAAVAGGAMLIAFPKHLSTDQTRDAWAAVIVALFLAVLLSYRSALTLSKDSGADTGQAGNRTGADLPDAPDVGHQDAIGGQPQPQSSEEQAMPGAAGQPNPQAQESA
jgi:hypothetical protein